MQGGDFVKFDGTGCYRSQSTLNLRRSVVVISNLFLAVYSLLSIYGGVRFADEDLGLAHKSGSVVMANAGVLLMCC